ncbi:MAG: valine--tRNA ligase [Myxococcota bacterium]
MSDSDSSTTTTPPTTTTTEAEPLFAPSFDHGPLEAACRARWDAAGLHRFDPDGPGEVFAVDTPPPYVSAAHLHVGHAMSYTQAEFVVRYHRMCGERIFYPMGFDDNGLPTERHVEQVHRIDKSTTSRAAFRALCLAETQRGAAAYEALWRSLGLSVDWSLRYSTIDDHCQRTAQRSFLDLYRSGRIRRTDAPVAWDPVAGTALAQADLELLERRTKLHTLSFGDLRIATTRPELLPACVAVYHHPDDARYRGRTALPVPLFGREVPVYADPDVDPGFGTGLLMVCTFGDSDDVARWRRDRLPLRAVIGRDGRLTDAAGRYAGLDAAKARDAIVRDLDAAGLYHGFTMVTQRVPVSERTQAPIEWIPVPQWSVEILDLRDRLRARSAELRWFPPFMKDRLDAWIDGVAWNWTASRQRFYGVPFPVWLCADCGEAVLADPASLPVDPLESPPPASACPACGGALRGDPDVMDTWMTSSSTWAITANLAGTPGRTAGPFPATVRVQAFEIVRTWLYYSLVKAELHQGALPFRDVMISGWGLDEQGHKISKRNLKPDADGFSRYDPAHLIDKYGADALRHWAGRTSLGRDLRFSEKDVRAGRKVAVKLWNAARLAYDLLGPEILTRSPAPAPLADRDPLDRGLLHALDGVLAAAADGLAGYDYATGLHALDRWFFATFCDDWLEACKDRLRHAERFDPANAASARATLWEALRAAIGAYAPYLPFVTDAIWIRLYHPHEGGPSVHVTRFPAPRGVEPVAGLDRLAEVLGEVRRWRTERSIPQSRPLASLTIDTDPADHAALTALLPALTATCRVDRVTVRVGSPRTIAIAAG